MRVSVAFGCLLVGCGAGDLTLPESPEPPAPFTLSIISGDGQRADAGTLLDRPLVVQVLDNDSIPVPGASVEFSFLGEVTGADVDPGVVTTGDDGMAEAFVRLGTDSGTQMILARVVGAATPELTARFRATAVEVRGGGGGDDGGPGKDKGKGDEDEDD